MSRDTLTSLPFNNRGITSNKMYGTRLTYFIIDLRLCYSTILTKCQWRQIRKSSLGENLRWLWLRRDSVRLVKVGGSGPYIVPIILQKSEDRLVLSTNQQSGLLSHHAHHVTLHNHLVPLYRGQEAPNRVLINDWRLISA